MFKKSLDNILGMFTKAEKELAQWEELTAAEQEQVEQRLTIIKQERARARKAREALKTMLGL